MEARNKYTLKAALMADTFAVQEAHSSNISSYTALIVREYFIDDWNTRIKQYPLEIEQFTSNKLKHHSK